MPTSPSLGTRIRRRRQELRLTQQQLADKVGVDASSVINWEKDKHFPKRHLGALEAALDTDLVDRDERTLSAEGLEERHRQVEAALEAALAQLRGGNGQPRSA